MKRAIFVSTGTVAGVMAALSYTPGLITPMAMGELAPEQVSNATKASLLAAKSRAQEQPARTTKSQVAQRDKKPSDKQKPNPGGDDKRQGGGGGGDDTKTKAAGGAPTTSPSGGGGGSGSGGNGSGGGSSPSPSPSPHPSNTPKPTPSPSPSPSDKPRTYVGQVATTPFGPVQVSITVLSGQITEASAVKYPSADPKSVEIAQKCLPKLQAATLSAQSARIATVSGATYTSNGWIASLQSALNEAKL